MKGGNDKSSPFRWGVAGCGDVVWRHVGPAIQALENCRIRSFLTRSPEKGEEYASRFGAERVFSDVDKFLSDPEIEAVYVALPVFLHKGITEKAASAGKHVLCEKPMAMNGRECASMVHACRGAGMKLAVAYYRRFFPRIRKIKELLTNGEIGKIINIGAYFATGSFGLGREVSDPWRLDPEKGGGGVLQDVGSHMIDLVLYLGGNISQVWGRATSRQEGWQADDTVSAWLQLRSGAHACLFFACNTRAQVESFEILGTKGRIRVDDLKNGRNVFLQTGQGFKCFEEAARESHRPLIENFVESVRKGKEPLISGEEGAKTTRVIDAIYLSTSNGRVITL